MSTHCPPKQTEAAKQIKKRLAGGRACLDEVGVLGVEVERHDEMPHRRLHPPQPLADLGWYVWYRVV